MKVSSWSAPKDPGVSEYTAQLAYILDKSGASPAMVVRSNDMHQFESISNERDDASEQLADHMDSTPMSTQDRYIEMRLSGIESKLDARMEAMQRFQEQAEARFQRATERHETDIALARQQIHQEFKDARLEMASESQANRKHSTQVALGTVAGVLAAFALVVTVAVGWIGEQGGYSEMRLNQLQSEQEMNEFREAVQSIQQTQQSILERLPAPQEPTEQ